MGGWVGFDLDGTIAHYDGWHSGKIGRPIMPMIERIRDLLSRHIEVRIFTARVSGCAEETAEQEKLIKAWCKEHIGFVLPITCKKDFAMIELYDDRAVQVRANTGEIATFNRELIEAATQMVFQIELSGYPTKENYEAMKKALKEAP